MPPKAKVKAKAKARVGVLRRPAGHLPLRRPAAAPEGIGQTPWVRGMEVELADLNPLDLELESSLVVTEADYFGGRIKVAGVVKKVELDQSGWIVHLKARGTDSEALLRAHTASPGQLLRGHLCPKGCGLQESGDYFLHLLKGRRGKGAGEDPWTTNLDSGGVAAEEEDEMSGLRRRSEELQQQERAPGRGTPGGEVQREGAQQKAQGLSPEKSKKKKKEKKRSKGMAEGRYPSAACQKEAKSLFGGTGLDPREKVRRRVLAKAQKFVSKKRNKTSSKSSDSSESTSSPTVEDVSGLETVFTEDTKVRATAERFPGALAMEAISNMRSALLTTSGEELDDKSVRPVAVLYYRSILSKKAQGAPAREMLNLTTALDSLLRGRPAAAADILAQRLKAQEAVAQGTHWAVAQRMEVVPSDVGGLVARQELEHARREDFEESRARWRAQASSGQKGEPKGKGKSSKGDRDSWRRDDKKEDGKDKKGKGQERK